MTLHQATIIQQQTLPWDTMNTGDVDSALEQSMSAQQVRIQMLANNIPHISPSNQSIGKGEGDRFQGQAMVSISGEEYATPIPISNSITPSNPPSSFRRVDAIAKLKRAASQREMKGRGEASTSRAQTPLEETIGAADSTTLSLAYEEDGRLAIPEISRRAEGAPHFPSASFSKQSSGLEGYMPASPIPPAMTRIDQLRSDSHSPQRNLRDGALTPENGSLLNRSRSQRGDARSPLPSLEQLRARILHERATAGLARSASTSAASAAARAYALEKLLGESPRQGAVSPVSDTAEDQEEEDVVDDDDESKKLRPLGIGVPQNDIPRLSLRRSRTIGGLSATAEAQRKAAFVQALDEGIPEKEKSVKRSSRRFARAPPGGRSSMSSKPSDPPIYEEGGDKVDLPVSKADCPTPNASSRGEAANDQVGLVETVGADLDRSQSQRQIVRAEMFRKLSGRGRNGQKSPLPPITNNTSVEQNDLESNDTNLQSITIVNQDSLSIPVTPPAAATSLSLTPHSPGFNLLTVPGSSFYSRSPSSQSSTGMNSLHEYDRNRASEMAKLMDEEAFEYERLLEMGYSTDDAFERVASARSGSFMDLSANVSPRSYQAEFVSPQSDVESPVRSHRRPFPAASNLTASHHSQLMQETLPIVSATTEMSPAQTTQEEWNTSKHSSLASIPLAFAAWRRSSEMEIRGEEKIEMLNGGNRLPSPSERRAAWPESVTSATTIDTYSSPKRSGSIKRDSESAASIGKARPMLLNLPSTSTNLERIEDVLTPGFLKEIGNPLDFSSSPVDGEQSFRQQQQDQLEGNDNLIDDEHDDDDGKNYLDRVDQMTKRLELFTRRNDSNRLARDATVQQSSAAQVVAAASDVARSGQFMPEKLDSAANETMLPMPPFANQPFTSPPANTTTSSSPLAPNSSPPTSFRPLPGSRNHSTSNSIDSYQHFTNGKLSPFPGLFPSPTPSADTSSTSLARRPSPLKVVPAPSLGRAVNFTEADGIEKNEATTSSKLPTFLNTLRRKASNATSKVHGSSNNGSESTTNSGPSPSRKLGSLLRRKASESKKVDVSDIEPNSPSTSLLSLNSTSTLKYGTSVEMMGKGNGTTSADPLSPSSLAPATTAALYRYSRMLTLPNDCINQAAIIPGLTREDIENPPRTFLFATPILQVVTTSTVKDRYLFVFSDLLVIAKPIAPPKNSIEESDALPTLEWTFSVKDIIDVGQIKQLTVPNDERKRPAKNVTLMESFVDGFRWNPQQAIDSLITQSHLPRTPTTIAQLLHQTPELDRQQLTDYVFNSSFESQREIAKAYVELEKFSGVSIESALRSLLLEIRFPCNREAFEDLLLTFSTTWARSNRGLIKEAFTERLAIDLVFAIMALNDALHSLKYTTPGMFSKSIPGWSREEFLQAFRPRDEELVLSDRTLSRIFTSVSNDVIQQSLQNDEPGIRPVVKILSPGVPSRLIYGTYSNPIRVSIPQCDAHFSIRLYGEDLTFQPQILSFEQNNTQEFRVMSKSLGTKSIVFIKAGKNAPYYQSIVKADSNPDFVLPRSISVIVERAFKQHCFTIAFAGNKKYTLSIEGETKKNRCVNTIKERMTELAENSFRKGKTHALALQVLREACIEPEMAANLQRSASAAVPGQVSRLEMGALNRTPSDSRAFGGSYTNSRLQLSSINRKESVSKHYYQSLGKREKELAPLMEASEEIFKPIHDYSLPPLRGEELIVTVKQNSLLSIVVSRLRQESR